MSPQDREVIALLSLLAAFSDGHLGREERARIQELAVSHGFDRVSTPGGDFEADPVRLARRLSTPTARRVAYEACVGVCYADGIINPGEEKFLEALRGALGLEAEVIASIEERAAELTSNQPNPETASGSGGSADEAVLEGTILRHAMLAAAAETLPSSLATLAIIPIQMRLVGSVGQAYGYRLDASQLKELLATAGLGVTAQMVDGLARRMVGGVARSLGGKMFGGMFGEAAGTAASAALTFATTYGIGHASLAYYRGGRSLAAVEIQALFDKMKTDGQTLYPRMEAEIKTLADRLDLDELMRSLKEGFDDLRERTQV